MEWESGVAEEGSPAARHGSWSVCDRLESHAVFALAEESETRCSHASKVCDRLESFEDGGVAICYGTNGLFSPFFDLCVGFVNDAFCDSLILDRFLSSHRSCPYGEVCPCFASSHLALFFFDHLQTQTNIVVYAPSYCRNPIRGPTSCGC